MEDWIAGTFAVLGTLMILAGGTLIVLRTLGRAVGPADPDTVPLAGSPATPPTDPAAGRRFSLRRLSPATQLLGWGVLLLVVAACAVGLVNVGISLNAGDLSARCSVGQRGILCPVMSDIPPRMIPSHPTKRRRAQPKRRKA